MALTLDVFRSRFLLQQPARSTQRLSGRHAAVLV
ncbi:CoA pyrophosphatase, partial [Pantoea allii]